MAHRTQAVAGRPVRRLLSLGAHAAQSHTRQAGALPRGHFGHAAQPLPHLSFARGVAARERVAVLERHRPEEVGRPVV